MRFRRALATLSLAASAGLAAAAPVTSLPGAESLGLPAPALQGAGSFDLGRGVWLFTSNPEALVGFSGLADFGSNGSWSGRPMIGLNTAGGSFELRFDNPISGFLADFNWTTGLHSGNAAVSAFDAGGALLDTLVFEKKTGDLLDPGFHGFLRATADIARLQFNNESIAIRDLGVTGLPAQRLPEPGSLALAGLALLGLGAAVRRARR